MQSSKPDNLERIYIDTNVWFSYITGGKYDNTFAKASKLINDIINNKNQLAIISQLVLLEMLNILRNRITQRERFQGKLTNNSKLGSQLQSTIDLYSTKFVDSISKWESSRKLLILNLGTPLNSFFSEVQKIQSRTIGTFEDVAKCGICRRQHDSYKYKGVDHYDIQHALIAKSGNADRLVTFDRGYNLLIGNGLLGNLKIEILK